MKLKLWGSYTLVTPAARLDGRAEARVIVRAASQRRAVEMLNESKLIGGNITLGGFRDYWSKTGNAKELATGDKEGIWYATRSGDVYMQAWPVP